MSEHRPELLALDVDDDLAREVLALQREAYAVEAALIGSDGIPALTETLEQLRDAGEAWLGVFDAAGLCGAVAWQRLDDETIDICRLIVAPRAFRGGVATALLDELDRRFPASPMIVSTGSANEPALALYRRRGFHPVRQREAAPGLMVTELARPATAG
jgi:ribosomal protein S18 acetylase RimI-like enzyme